MGSIPIDFTTLATLGFSSGPGLWEALKQWPIWQYNLLPVADSAGSIPQHLALCQNFILNAELFAESYHVLLD